MRCNFTIHLKLIIQDQKYAVNFSKEIGKFWQLFLCYINVIIKNYFFKLIVDTSLWFRSYRVVDPYSKILFCNKVQFFVICQKMPKNSSVIFSNQLVSWQGTDRAIPSKRSSILSRQAKTRSPSANSGIGLVQRAHIRPLNTR